MASIILLQRTSSRGIHFKMQKCEEGGDQLRAAQGAAESVYEDSLDQAGRSPIQEGDGVLPGQEAGVRVQGQDTEEGIAVPRRLGQGGCVLLHLVVSIHPAFPSGWIGGSRGGKGTFQDYSAEGGQVQGEMELLLEWRLALRTEGGFAARGGQRAMMGISSGL